MAKILLVEDERIIRDDLTQSLEGWGHQVVPTCDGVEALERTELEGFDLIVSDWIMPRLTGIELCETLKGRESTQDIPFIMLTVKKSQDDIAKAYDAGVGDYLTKPVKVSDLQASISKAIG